MNLTILENLGRGKENAVSRKDLSALTKMSDRNVRANIQRMRYEGVPILSDCRTGGYYLPDKAEEVDGFIAMMEKGAKKRFKAVQSAKEWRSEHHSDFIQVKL